MVMENSQESDLAPIGMYSDVLSPFIRSLYPGSARSPDNLVLPPKVLLLVSRCLDWAVSDISDVRSRRIKGEPLQ